MVKKLISLSSTYGVQREDIRGTPFSLKAYIKYMMCRSSWGDDTMLQAFSRMHGLKNTVVNAVMLEESRVRHDVPLQHADLVLVYNGKSHYAAAGK